MKRKQLIRNRIEQKTAERKKTRKKIWTKSNNRAKNKPKGARVDIGGPIINPTAPLGRITGSIGEFVKTLRRGRR